jgi:hypothetical protein
LVVVTSGEGAGVLVAVAVVSREEIGVAVEATVIASWVACSGSVNRAGEVGEAGAEAGVEAPGPQVVKLITNSVMLREIENNFIASP